MHKTTLSVCLAFGILSAATASAELAGSKHDLTRDANTVFSTDAGTICVFCHIPHVNITDSSAIPQWAKQQKDAAAAQYSLYNWVIPGKGTPAGAPSSGSLSCLSCHDGTIGRMIFYPYTYGSLSSGSHGTAFIAGIDTSSKDNFTGDHPVSVRYNSLRAGLASLATARKNGLAFYGPGHDELECASCHNPHTTANKFSLEKPEGELCVACHAGRADGKHVMAGYGFGDDHPVKGKPDPLHPGRDISCATCHNTHAGTKPSVVPEEKPGPMCLKCHIK